jgi:hypothetical protein
VTISPHIRIGALVAVVALLGIGAFALLELGHHSKTTPPPARATHRHATATASASHAASAHHTATSRHAATHASAASALTAEQLPARLTHLLRYHSIVVAVLYAPGVAGETGVVGLARTGAKRAHAGFIALDVREEKTAELVSLRFPNAFDPTVLILNRQGEAVTMLNGVQQSTAVAQAVLDVRR